MTQSFIKKLARGLVYGFNKELRPYEQSILSRAMAEATAEDREAIESQLALRNLIQRSNADRMVAFGFVDKSSLNLVADRSNNHCFAQVKLSTPLGRLIAVVMTHRGVISSMEFSAPPKIALANDFKILSVSLTSSHLGFSPEINAVEHDD